MRSTLFHKYSLLSLIVVPLVLAVAMLGTPAPAAAPSAPPTPMPIASSSPISAAPPLAVRPLATLAPTTVALPLQPPTADPALAMPATPVAPPTLTVPRFHIAVQAGHWRANELPTEQTHLHISAGTSAAGYSEVQITVDIAQRVAKLLESIGVAVDLLPATIPPGYSADAFVALHADGFAQADARGFNVATAWAASPASQHLFAALTSEYERATGLPRHSTATADMRSYYAFNYRRYAHALAKTTPAVIVEMGFLTNQEDRYLLTHWPDVVAVGIANGIVRYLNDHDPSDQAALEPPDFGVWRGAAAAGLDIRAAPSDDAQILLHIESERPLIPFEKRSGWFHVIVAGAWDVVGWVREDALVRMEGY